MTIGSSNGSDDIDCKGIRTFSRLYTLEPQR
jgi:hypothetical protein